MRVTRSWMPAALVLFSMSATPLAAKTVEVRMLNRGSAGGMMVFEPAFVAIKPGDSVSFVPADKGHDVVALPEIAPAGTQPFVGRMSQPLTVKFTAEGLYGYKCSPHAGMGMVGLVQVGKPVNKAAAGAAAAKLPGLAKARMTGLVNAAH